MCDVRHPAESVGVSLSGGGYRASAFHLGTLNKLNEMGILPKVSVLSTISGGSITGAAWCLHEGTYEDFHAGMIDKLHRECVIRKTLRSWICIRTILVILAVLTGVVWLMFTPYAWVNLLLVPTALVLFSKFQFVLFNVSAAIEKQYDKIFYHKKTLPELKERPVLAIGASNLHTGRPFTFSRTRMSDSTYRYSHQYKSNPVTFVTDDFPVARAVMASSCVPFAFSPVRLAKRFYKHPEQYQTTKPVLVDGGVYDNQGIHKIAHPSSTYYCETIITSDAGGNFMGDKTYNNTFTLLLRTVGLFMYRIKNSQMSQYIYGNHTARPIAYFSLGWDLEYSIINFYNNLKEGSIPLPVLEAHQFTEAQLAEPAKHKKEIISHLRKVVGFDAIQQRALSKEEWEYAASTGTNLTRLPLERIRCLVRHAEDLTELHVRLYCPALVADNALPLQR